MPDSDAAADCARRPATPQIEERMRHYYAQRAAYYERVYHKSERQSDLRALEAWVARAFAGRRVLEIAAGTGWWTAHGASRAHDWLATDMNPETLDVARSKAMPASVRFAAMDAYRFDALQGLRGDAPFDAAFAGCWWSHVPLARLPGWLDALHAQLAPGARVVFLDNSFVQTSSTPISRRDDTGNTYQLRSLDDGSQHEVLKNFPTRDEAFTALGASATERQWLPFTHYWVLSYRLR
jgi:demethylmenaquinone methyltransferase/2-methoxy-6-polyprenyl-1,4-benzoquinol methylase